MGVPYSFFVEACEGVDEVEGEGVLIVVGRFCEAPLVAVHVA